MFSGLGIAGFSMLFHGLREAAPFGDRAPGFRVGLGDLGGSEDEGLGLLNGMPHLPEFPNPEIPRDAKP